MKLTAKEELAVSHFMRGEKKTIAYELAGYGVTSPRKTLNENACRFFKRKKIAARIDQLTRKVEKSVMQELKIDRKFVTEGILRNIEMAEMKKEGNVALKGYEMLSKMYDLNEDKINDRVVSDKNKMALLENLKQRMVDVTPEEEKE